MKKLKFLCINLLIIFLLTACGSKEETSEEIELTPNTIATEETDDGDQKIFGEFTSQTIDGENVTEDVFSQADLTMVNIWGTFCGPCIQEMPGLGNLAREYEDKGVQIVGIISDVTEPENETALEIIEATNVEYMNLITSEDLYVNALQYISAVPMTAFVDKEGNMVGEIYAGSREEEDWGNIINMLLEEVQK